MTLNPWQLLRGCWPLTCVHADLPPGEQARLYPGLNVIMLGRHLNQAERRSSLAHEMAHWVLDDRADLDDRGGRRQERCADDMAARWLIGLDELAAAMLWSRDETELADELWVDVPTVRARLAALTDAEKDIIERRVRAREEGAA